MHYFLRLVRALSLSASPIVWFVCWIATPLARVRPRWRPRIRRARLAAREPLCRTVRKPRFQDLQSVAAAEGLFEHQSTSAPLGLPQGSRPMDVIVIDGFYEDPDPVREFAIRQDYSPYAYGWWTTVAWGNDSDPSVKPTRLASDDSMRKLGELTGSEIDIASWETGASGWNGAFHYRRQTLVPAPSTIHNHVGDENLLGEGWVGVVYLNPRPLSGSGSTIWRDRRTGYCYSRELVDEFDPRNFELCLNVKNVYNRIVLCRASVFHRAEPGFGFSQRSARLVQTFMFNVKKRSWNIADADGFTFSAPS